MGKYKRLGREINKCRENFFVEMSLEIVQIPDGDGELCTRTWILWCEKSNVL